MEIQDLIIIGGGPAGLSAGIYAGRYQIKTMIISPEIGGMAATAHKVCNFPTYEEISGLELIEKMEKQTKNLGVKFQYGNLGEIIKKDDFFEVKTEDKNIYQAKKIIYATGTKRRQLGIETEKDFLGKGVSYCATCDGAFFRNKKIGVVGGSDSALTAALLLADYGEKVYIIYRQEKFFRAEPSWVDLVEKNPKIETVFNENVIELLGEKKLEKVKLESGKEIELDGLFIEIGSDSNIVGIDKLDIEMDGQYIKVNKSQETNLTGFYAAGDITSNSDKFKQIITACAEGSVAAHAIYESLQKEQK